MKICNMCRSQLPDTYTACPNCGNPNLVIDQTAQQPMNNGMQQPMNNGMQQPMGGYQQPMYQQPMPMGNQQVEDKGNFLYAIPGLLIPLVGIILYFVLKKSKPQSAKIAGIAGLIGWAFWFIVNMMA